MKMFLKNFLRAIGLAATLYLMGDALIFQGPVHRWLRTVIPVNPKDVVARVEGHAITRSQHDRAIAERLWLIGKSSSANQTAADRAAALDELIDHELLRLEVKAQASQLPVSEKEVDERLRRFASRFESQEALAAAMKSQGIAEPTDLRARLASQIQQEKYIALRIAPAIQVSDAEARQWFARHAQAVAHPERIEARHIFIPTLDQAPETAKRKLEAALVSLTAKQKDFATLAKALSEDPATQNRGGDLGWMTRDRLPADFAAPLFALEQNQPTLIRTKIGWHLCEVTARKGAEPRSFDQAKPEIVAALDALKRRQAVADFRKSLRNASADRVEVIHRLLD
jgi:parvulin-like peptidyl-prolyl isomerase